MSRVFLLGLLLGIGAGWLLSRATMPSLPDADGVAARDEAPGAGPTLAPDDPPAAASPAAAPSVRTAPGADLASATADDLHRRWNATGNEVTGGKDGPAERLTVEEGRALLERARAALRDRDGALFVASVRGLARAEGDEADAFLLDVMADVSLPAPGPMGAYFHEALKDSRLSGIAAAARARFEAEVAAGRDHWWGARGWLHLVADHGTEEDVQWLRGIASRRGQAASEAADALARSRNPAAPAAFESLRGAGRSLDEYLAAHPERVVAYLEERIDGRVPSELDRRSLWQTYARHAPEASLADLERRLLAAEGIREKADAVYGMQALSRRGHDLTALRGLVPSLLDWLAAHAGAEESTDERSTVLYALEYNPVAWTRETLAVLERVAPESDAAKEIRAHLDHPSPWR